MLITSYLGLMTKARKLNGDSAEEALANLGLKDPKIYYIMRDRGNNEVAPTKEALAAGVGNRKAWNAYKKAYEKQLETEEAQEWMQRVADESLWQDVVLVCYERSPDRCHRSLLAKEIRRHPGVNYVGELSLVPHGKGGYVSFTQST